MGTRLKTAQRYISVRSGVGRRRSARRRPHARVLDDGFADGGRDGEREHPHVVRRKGGGVKRQIRYRHDNVHTSGSVLTHHSGPRPDAPLLAWQCAA